MNLPRILAIAAAISFAFGSIAQARTWTNKEGKRIEAEFVNVDEERVTLRMPDGKEVKILLEKLHEDDQLFLQRILLKRKAKGITLNDTSSDPTEESTKPKKSADGFDAVENEPTPSSPTPKPAKPKFESRAWTDALGNKINAKYQRMQGNFVVLLRNGLPFPIDFFKLSDDDQQYVKDLLVAAGEPTLIPTAPSEPLVANPTTTTPASGTIPTFTTPSTFTPPSYTPPPMTSASTMGNTFIPPMPVYTPPTYTPPPTITPMPAYPSSASTGGSTGYTPPTFTQPTYNPSSFPPPTMPAPYIPPTPTFTPPPSMQTQIKVCGKCNREVPQNLTAGDSCPHCHTRFDYDETNGKKAPIHIPSVIGAIAAAVIGVGIRLAINAQRR